MWGVHMRRYTSALPLLTASMCAVLLTAHVVHAVETTLPVSALVPSTNYYTDTIGGGIGDVVVMTGGGNANGASDPSGRNDDGFSGPKNLGSRSIFLARIRHSTG